MKNREGLPQFDKKISTENSWLTTITVNGEKLDAFFRRSVKRYGYPSYSRLYQKS